MATTSERTYHTTNSPYTLPNDASEHDRLEIQTQAINTMMHGQPNHADLLSPHRILEVGCGTGSTTRHLAERYPAATEVIGVDLSAVPPQKGSSSSSQTISFLQGDFHSLATHGADSPLPSDSFDYIFSRMLIFGMTDWPSYISKAKDLLKSNGWLELQELEFFFYDEDQQPLSESWQWLQDQTAGWSKLGLDMQIGAKLEQYLKDAGFVDVHVKVFRWVYGHWNGHPETDMIGAYSPKYLIAANIGAYKKVLGSQKTVEQLAMDEARIRRDMEGTPDGKHMPFFVVYGRKP